VSTKGNWAYEKLLNDFNDQFSKDVLPLSLFLLSLGPVS